MSNLGAYQTMTKVAKKVGGPKNLFFITVGCGYLTIRLAESGAKAIARKVRKVFNNKEIETLPIYTIHTEHVLESGLTLSVGNTYRILATDGEAVLIEIIDNNDNPYFASTEVLKMISDYEEDEE